MSDTTFSLEINEKYTRICDAHLTHNQIELTALGSAETVPYFFTTDTDSTAEKQAEIISKLCTELRIKKKNVNVVIPDGYTYSQIVEMPKLKEKELLAAIHYQADEFIPMPIDETNLDLEILREDPKAKKSLILIAASPKKMVDQIEKTVIKAGLIPETLENEMSAVGRIFSDVIHSVGGPSIIVNIGYFNTSIYVLDSDQTIFRLVRTFNLGLNLYAKDIMVNMNWDEKKAYEALKTIGLGTNASYNIVEIIQPLVKELYDEVEKILILARDRLNLKITKIYTMNLDNQIASLREGIQEHFKLPTQSIQLEGLLVRNPLASTFTKEISSFISVIAGNLR